MPKKPKIDEEINFLKKDMHNVQVPHDDALVIHATVFNFGIKIVLVDTENAIDMLFSYAFKRKNFSTYRLKPCKAISLRFYMKVNLP